MARTVKTNEQLRYRILFAAAKCFLEKGYEASTFKVIAAAAGTNYGSIQNLYPLKEDLMCEMVKYALNSQFSTTAKLLEGITDDKLLFYAAETTLQLYMAELNEKMRELYGVAYSMPKTTAVIQHTLTEKLEEIFKDHLPDLKTQDFYMLEIATGGIMRNFMMVPCNMWFTLDMKVKTFLETTFRVYCVPQEKIDEAIAFVKKFDYAELAQNTISAMVTFLEERTK